MSIRLVSVNYYTEDDGSYSADSPDVRGWTAIAPDWAGIREMAREGLAHFLAPALVVIGREFLDGALYRDRLRPVSNSTSVTTHYLAAPGVAGPTAPTGHVDGEYTATLDDKDLVAVSA